MKKLVLITIICAIILGVICGVALAKDFSDIASSHWAFTYVNDLSNKGIINGYEDGSFRPSNNVTRAEFLKLMVGCLKDADVKKAEQGINKMGVSALSEYNQVWYIKYILLAKYAELYKMNDLNEDFINAPISRREMVEVLYKFGEKYNLFDKVKMKTLLGEPPSIINIAYDLGYIKDKDMELEDFNAAYKKLKKKQKEEIEQKYNEAKNSQKETTIITIYSEFSDVSDVTNEYAMMLEKVYKAGLLTGYEDKTFRLDNNLTRAEVSTVIYRCLSMRGE